MKTLKLVVLGMVLFFAGAANAQISVRLNLGVQPQWAPVGIPAYSTIRHRHGGKECDCGIQRRWITGSKIQCHSRVGFHH